MQIDDYETLLMDSVASLEDNLMDLEMHLQDALHESTNKFRDMVMEKNKAMKEKSIDYIKQVLEQADIFHTQLKNSALIEQAAFDLDLNDENYQEPDKDDVEYYAKFDILVDKEELIAFLDAYKDFMELKLNEKEKFVTRGIEDEWKNIESNVSTAQHNRNRSIVKEVIETCQDFRNGLKDKFDNMREEYDQD